MKTAFRVLGLLSLSLLTLAPSVHSQAPEVFTEDGFISGTMNIDFGTRKNLDTTGSYVDGSPAKDSKDVYDMNLTVARTTEYAGKVTRKPRLVTRVLGREEQPATLSYAVSLAVRNPKDLSQKKQIGKWVGDVQIDKNGVYDLDAGATDSQLRMAIDAVGKGAGFIGKFGGKIYGKGSKEKGLIGQQLESVKREYTRVVKGKTLKVTADKVDPLKFGNLTLGEGPAPVYPSTVVNGNLDYDYDTGNWYTDGIRFKYASNGVEYEDIVTGSIKWVEDPNRSQNGKGQYEFNLRFNEAKNKPATDEAAAFTDGAGSQDEEAFFAVDNSVPGLNGTVSYVDNIVGGGEDEEGNVISSKITYNLNANKLTKQQAVNFFKLWLTIVGPTNDE